MFQFRDFADANNLILIAPTFSRWYQPWQGRYPIGYMPPTWVVAGSQEDRAMLDEYYQRKWGIPYPWDFSENLYWFVDLVTPYSQYRTDLALNYIFDLFREQFPDLSDRFMLYGHSGGGQFTARYMLTHPERLSKVALSSAGSLLFPLFDRNFPVGMNCAHIIEEGYGTAGRPPGYAADLMALREEDWLLKIAKLHRIPTIVTVGSKENGPNDDTDAMRNWQGKNTLEKTRNFALAMNSASAAARLRLIGGGGARRGSTLGSSGFASLSPATGIGRLWPDDAYYEPLYLEFDETHADNLSCTVDWLSRFWADYPHKVPYYTNDLGWHYV
jgi:pimeloyl-ACP methyl ester carboxylesterase